MKDLSLISNKTRLRVCTVTPCHDRPTLVENLLKTLDTVRAEDSILKELIDFIIVDSTPENSEAATHIRTCCEAVGAVYLQGPQSVRSKRNMGALRAREMGADVVLFIDSDCQAQPGLFREHQVAYQTAQAPFTGRPVGAVIGITRFVGEDSMAYRAAAQTPFLDSFSFAENMPEAPWAPCTNFSVLLKVFEQLGGFSENWNYRLGGDDTELGRRLNNAGYAIFSRPQAVVFHDKTTWNCWSAIIERAWRWGRMDINVRSNEPAENRQWIAPQPLPIAVLIAPVALLGGVIPLLTVVGSALVLAPLFTGFLRTDKNSLLIDYIGAEFLLLVFQLGSLYESIKVGRPWLSYVEVVSHPMQIGTSWDTRRRSGWVTVLMFFVWIVLLFILFRT